MISISKRRLPSLRDAIPLGLIASFAFTATAGVASANSSTIDFESGYTAGNIHTQNGWLKTGAYDVQVADVSGFANASSFGFGDKALRISNAVTSGAFGDQAFAPALSQAAGESGKNRFEASFDIGSTAATQQTGLVNSFSPDNGQGGRMSYLRFEDQADGVHVFFVDVTNAGPMGASSNYNETDIATLNRTAAHHVRLSMSFAPGPGNDLVKVYIDGVLKHTGTSWENYYRYDPEAAGNGNVVPMTTTMLFRAGGAAVAANAGNGYLIDNISLDSSDIVACTTDCYVDATSGNDANGGTSATDAKKTIQAAVSQVSTGGTVHVAAGTYREQVVANHDLTIDGAGAGATTIKAPSSMVVSTDPGRYAIVEVKNGADVEMSDLTVSGPGATDSGSLHYGILVTGAAHLDAHDMSITDIRDAFDSGHLSGAQNGNGIQVGRQAIGQTGTADIDNVTVTGYQKTGFIVDNAGSWMNVTDSTVTGAGATPWIAQNGIQISRGATASVTDSTISGNEYTGTQPADSTDILLYQAGNNVSITGNHISGADVGIDVAGGSIGGGFAAHRNSIHDNGTGVSSDVGGSINAECNWWGAANGPSTVGTGSGDMVSAGVDFEPWLESSDLDGDCSGVSLNGVLAPASHDFGSQAVGTTSTSSTFTYTNEGYETLNVTDVVLAGLNLGQFEIDTNNCDGAALSHGQSCTIEVVFEPNSTGSKTARLEVDSNAPTAVSNLTGNGTSVVASNGTIKIVLDARPDGSQAFAFNGGLGAFSLVDNGTPANTLTFSKPAGDYDVQAAKVGGWTLKSLSCSTPESIKKGKRKVTIHLTAGENVTCTFTETKRVPDASISLSQTGAQTGVGIYAGTTQAAQTQARVIPVGQTQKFFVNLKNAGMDSDSYRLWSTLTGSTRYRVHFFRGATDITAKVNAATYSLSLAAGAQTTIEVRVTTLSGTPAGATREIDLTFKSKTSTAKDVVRAHVSRQ